MPTPLAADLTNRIFGSSPYEGFDYQSLPSDLQGGGGSDVLAQAFDAIKPTLIVEVGAWKGASAIFWAKRLRDAGIDGAVLCVDTWLGGLDHMIKPKGEGWEIRPYYEHGYPRLYHQFLANVMHEGLQDYIVPFPNTSVTGARWLRAQGLSPDLIYIDASHEEDDVLQDLREYWRVLRLGGLMCGDDWAAAWYGVICAVNRFRKEVEAGLQVSGTHWVIPKGLSEQQQTVLGAMSDQLVELKQAVEAHTTS